MRTFSPSEAVWQHARGSTPLRAKDLLSLMDINEPPVDIYGIINSLGVELEVSGDTEYSGALDSGRDPPKIILSAHEGDFRQRFTAAHELGHLMLHPLGEWYRDKVLGGSPQEIEANRFAADLLMPKYMISVALRTTNASTERMAKMFHVSEQAMNYRLKNILGF